MPLSSKSRPRVSRSGLPCGSFTYRFPIQRECNVCVRNASRQASCAVKNHIADGRACTIQMEKSVRPHAHAFDLLHEQSAERIAPYGRDQDDAILAVGRLGLEHPVRSLGEIAPDASKGQGHAARDGAVDTVRGVSDSRVSLGCNVYSGTSKNG